MKIEAAPHAKAHQSYHTADGVKVPGVTTVIGQLGKPFLITWANKLGLEGYESGPYTAAQARVGSLAHALIAEELGGEKTNPSDYSVDELVRAQNVVRSFRAWRTGRDLQPLLVEQGLVSEAHRYGGTIDLYASLDGRVGVIDVKSSNGIYDEHKIQICTYAKLLIENGHRCDFAMLLRMPRSADDSYEVWSTTQFDARFNLFLALLNVHQVAKLVKDDDENAMPKVKRVANSMVLTLSGGASSKPAPDASPVAVTTERET